MKKDTVDKYPRESIRINPKTKKRLEAISKNLGRPWTKSSCILWCINNGLPILEDKAQRREVVV